MDTVQKTAAGSQQRILEFDLASELHHGMLVSNLAYAVAEEMDCRMNSVMSLQ